MASANAATAIIIFIIVFIIFIPKSDDRRYRKLLLCYRLILLFLMYRLSGVYTKQGACQTVNTGENGGKTGVKHIKAAKSVAYQRYGGSTLGINCMLEVVKMIYRRLLTVVYTGYA